MRTIGFIVVVAIIITKMRTTARIQTVEEKEQHTEKKKEKKKNCKIIKEKNISEVNETYIFNFSFPSKDKNSELMARTRYRIRIKYSCP